MIEISLVQNRILFYTIPELTDVSGGFVDGQLAGAHTARKSFSTRWF
jgi:hypothetical protein